MEEYLQELFETFPTVLLVLIAAGALFLLAMFADLVVDKAVVLSEKSGIPKVIVGATVVSLGTTAPEVAVSVFAAFKGRAELAMGNAVGSIICDTGLILGIACLIAPLRIPMSIANRQGWVQLGSAILLVAFCYPWSAPASPYTEGAGGNFSQVAGFIFLGLLALYLYVSVKWSALQDSDGSEFNGLSTVDDDDDDELDESNPIILAKLIGGIIGVVVSANVLIPAVTIVAERWGVPSSIIAATMVAFGTSLPELMTAISAARKGHGDLAVGNIIGADVLNALFVAGAAAAVTPEGLDVSNDFFKIMFPAMLIVLVVFRFGIFTTKETLSRGFGLVLLGTYLVYLVVSIATLEHQEEKAEARNDGVVRTEAILQNISVIPNEQSLVS